MIRKEDNKKLIILRKIKQRINILNQLSCDIKSHGVENFKDEIKALKLNKLLYFETLVDGEQHGFLNNESERIINTVIEKCLSHYKKYGAKKEHLFQIRQGYTRTDNKISEFKKIVFILIKYNTELSDSSISKYFGFTRVLVNRVINEFNYILLNTSPKHRKLISLFGKINKTIK